MSWNSNRCYCQPAEFDRLAFRKNQILFRPRLVSIGVLIRWGIRWINQIPIGGRCSYFGGVVILEVFGTAKVVRVAMAKEDVFDFRWIKPKLLQPRDNDGFNPVCIS